MLLKYSCTPNGVNGFSQRDHYVTRPSNSQPKADEPSAQTTLASLLKETKLSAQIYLSKYQQTNILFKLN
jgi:hypothetical protein